MRHILLTVSFCYAIALLPAQSAKDLIAELRAIHQAVVQKGCCTDSAAAISNRAMNFFLADKTSYLSASRDLSFYTNYVTFSTAEGRFTVNHNFQKTNGTDQPIRQLFSVGFDMTIAGNFATSFLDKRFENELGITLNHKWLAKVKTRFAGDVANNAGQKQVMDAARATLLALLETAIQKKESDFVLSLNAIDSALLPGQPQTNAKLLLQQVFYKELKEDYEELFAGRQAALLTKTKSFQTVSTHWTSLTAYIPVVYPAYTLAPSLTGTFNKKHPYPFSLLLSHTRMCESSKLGRLFFTLDASLLFNNSKLGYRLSKMNFSEYKSLGGTDTRYSTDPGNNKLYIGPYKTLLTPAVTARLVYFPSTSHVGISLLAEKNFNDYNLLNAKLGIPVILINSKKTPAVTVECYVLWLDITNQLSGISKTIAGLSIGIPFSRLMY
ncbi:MAG: hypothetical protein ABIQ88_08330 [Chitinophagaceae bacterium]